MYGRVGGQVVSGFALIFDVSVYLQFTTQMIWTNTCLIASLVKCIHLKRWLVIVFFKKWANPNLFLFIFVIFSLQFQ